MLKEYLECGLVQNTHGVAGMLRVGHRCDAPEVFCSLKTVYTEQNGVYTPYRVLRATEHGAVILVALEGVDSIDAAVRLKNKVLYAKREDLPIAEGAHFIADLIGLSVIDAESGKKYGEITDVLNYGASDVYEIKTANGTALMPAVPAYVKRIDLGEGVFVTPIEGMFDDAV